MHQENCEIIIVGGGIAGLSTAWHLAEAGQRGVLLVEREDLPGFYASGHNAGIARQLTGRPEHTALAIQGRERLARAGLLLPPGGGYLLGAEPGGTRALARGGPGLRAGLPGGGRLAPARNWPRSSGWAWAGTGSSTSTPSCATAPAGPRPPGARLRFGCQALGIEPAGEGFRVDTDLGPVRARILVNAAGAWAGEVGRMAGGLDLAFRPLRRHLAWSSAPCPPDQPWAWWADRPLYLRPESGGTLLCPCDESLVDLPPRGRQPVHDPAVLEALAGSVQERVPALEDAQVARLWCGLRTFAPDRVFVLGPDPRNPSLHWVAGLGGHGMTSGLAVGLLAAQSILGKNSTGTLDPGRFWQH